MAEDNTAVVEVAAVSCGLPERGRKHGLKRQAEFPTTHESWAWFLRFRCMRRYATSAMA